jgi:hypothetical protein
MDLVIDALVVADCVLGGVICLVLMAVFGPQAF